MATPPDFSVGQVLTAAQMNAVGMWLVKSQAIGTGVSSVTVTDAFSADYDNYKIIVSGGTGNALSNLVMGLGSSVTGYYGLLQYGTYAGSAYTAAQNNNSIQWDFVGYVTPNYIQASFDLINPFKTNFTQILNAGWTPTTASGTFQGLHQVAASYSSFTIAAASVLTGGTIEVYGYRK